MKLSLITLGVAAATALSVGGAGAAPASFQLVFDGRHAPASFPNPTGLQHEGPFTTSSPLCPSGTAKDVASLGDDMAKRVFTCSSGAQFTTRVGPLLGEHGGAGTWQIVDGTGALADLRGKGIWQSRRSSGDLSDPATVTFQNTWQGVADLDAAPPTIAVARRGVQKVRKVAATYRVNLRLSLDDANGGEVSYTLSLADERNPAALVAWRSGETSTGNVSLSLRVKAAKTTRTLRLMVSATDAVGNEGSLTTTIRLR
jgi:hypothetical protein